MKTSSMSLTGFHSPVFEIGAPPPPRHALKNADALYLRGIEGRQRVNLGYLHFVAGSRA